MEGSQMVLMHELARSMLLEQTASEKEANLLARDHMSGSALTDLMQTIHQRQVKRDWVHSRALWAQVIFCYGYARIDAKNPLMASKLSFLGKTQEQAPAGEEANHLRFKNDSREGDNDLAKEVVKTQITQVAYHLRQKERAFDTACLLELLATDFLARKRCVAASRDLSKRPASEYKPETFTIKNNAKIVQLLLALSKQPLTQKPTLGSGPPLSNFAQRFLRSQMRVRANADILVKPHSASYMHSDCVLMERDKAESGRMNYFDYDTASFENSQFDPLTLNQPFLRLGCDERKIQCYRLPLLEKGVPNRFNKDFLGDSDGSCTQAREPQRVAPLMGATLRALDQKEKVVGSSTGLFGADPSPSSSAFGMTLQIPSLPGIDQTSIFKEDGSIDQTQITPTFSFFQPSATQQSATPTTQQPHSKPTVAFKTSLNQAPKLPKESKLLAGKKKAQKLNVWSLLPYVDESLLDNAVKKESGIARLWEDESLHLHMRDLSLCEPGVITAQKEASFRACFQKHVGSVIKVPGSSKAVKEKDLVRSLMLVLQGIPSKSVFELEKTTFTFNTNPNLVIADLCCTSESLQQLCADFTQAGCYFLHLREFSEFMASQQSKSAGQVVEAFALAIQDFLVFYQHQVNELERKAKAHRDANDTQGSSGGKESGAHSLSLLEIKVLMAPLLAQIQTIASICFTSKFIEDIELQHKAADSDAQSVDNNDEFKFMALLYQRNALTAANLKEQLETNLEKIRSQQWLNEFPRGAKLLTYLYRIMLASEADLQVIDLLRRIFSQSVRPILAMISEFITIGSFKDPFDEFFVEKLYRGRGSVSEQQQAGDDDDLSKALSEDFIYMITAQADKIPTFLASNDTAVTIFKIGCDLNLLKTKRQEILAQKSSPQQALGQYMNFSEVQNTGTKQRVNLPDYFAICASGDDEVNKSSTFRRLGMIEEASRELTLDFSMQRLQAKQIAEQNLFNRQSDKLQKIEQEIAREETGALLKQIAMREKAAIFRMTEAEKERERVLKIKAERKRQFMQSIQDDIAQKEKHKLALAQAEREERDRERQRQAENEKIHAQVAQNLRAQLMDLLKENQQMADTRTEAAIKKEALERAVNAQELRAEQAKKAVDSVAQEARNGGALADEEMKTVEGSQISSLRYTQQDAISDQRMVVDSAPEPRKKTFVPPQDNPKEIEPAGKASSVKAGGLAGMIFGTGLPQESQEGQAQSESSDEKMELEKEDSIDDLDDSKQDDQPVKLDDIVLEVGGPSQVNPESDEGAMEVDQVAAAKDSAPPVNSELAEETEAEKKAFIEKVFVGPLLQRVFSFINTKQDMESKRKTWNLKHQVTQAEHLKRKKTNWDYHSNQSSSLQTRMQALFAEHLEVQNPATSFSPSCLSPWVEGRVRVGQRESHTSAEEADAEAQSQDVFSVPVTLAVEQSVVQAVRHQHSLVNKCLLHLMHRGMHLLRHLEYLKMIYLASQGDVFAALHESIFNEDFQQTAKDSSLHFLNEMLEQAIRSTSSRLERDSNRSTDVSSQGGQASSGVQLGVYLAQLISEDGTELTKLRFVPSGKSDQIKINPNFFFTISNIGEYVRLEYATEHPLDRVISDQCIRKYNVLFFFLLKLKRVGFCLTLIWKELGGVEFRRLGAAEAKELRKLQFLWQQMHYFVRTIEEYVTVAVIQSAWTTLKQQLAQIDFFEELVSLHNAYLDGLLEKCFLGRARDNRLHITVNQIFDFVFKLHFLVRSYGVGVCRDVQAKQDLHNVALSFRDYSRFLYQIVRNLAQKGQFKELFVRLDFNKFYSNTAVKGGALLTRNIIR